MRRALGVLCLLLASTSLAAPPASGAGTVATTISVTMIDDLVPRVAGRASDFAATLVDDQGQPVAGQTLSLWTQPAGSATFDPAAQGTTDELGHLTLWVPLDRTALVEWRYDGAGSYTASAPVDFTIEIAPLVTARAHDRTLRRGQRLVLTGRTFPAKAGCRVSLWNGVRRPLTVGPAPRLLARSTVRADGRYRLVRRFHHATAMRVAVTVASCAGNARGLSRVIAIRVR